MRHKFTTAGFFAAWIAAATLPAAAQQSVTLTQAIAIAAASSPVLQAARDDYRLAQINIDFARVPNELEILGDASVQRTQQGGFGGSTVESVGASVQQLIYDGGRILAQIRSARASEASAFGTYQRAAQLLSFNVAQAYYNYLQAQASVQLDETIYKENLRQEDLIKAQIQAGSGTRVDLATTHLPTLGTEVALAQARGQLLAALAVFDQTIGMHADASVAPLKDPSVNTTNTLIPNEPLDVEKATARALLQRPDYVAAQHTVDAARESLHAARLGLAPQLTGSAGIGASSVPAIGFRSNNAIGITLGLPIYDQGLTKANTAAAFVQLDLAETLARESELGVESDVRQALANLEAVQGSLAKVNAQLAVAHEVLADTQQQYRAGITQLSLLLNAQTQLTAAEDEQLTFIYALRQAEQNYLYALGDS